MTSTPTAYLALPSAISLNQIYENSKVPGQKGRRKTEKYKKWCNLAAQYLTCQIPLPCFTVPVDVVLYVGEIGASATDVDNTAKALLDALVVAEIIPDDSKKWVRSCASIWVPDLEGTVAVIRPAREDIKADVVASMLSRAGQDLVLVRGAV